MTRFAGVLSLLMLFACREHDLMRCHFGEETPIAETRGGYFHAVRHLGEAIVWSAEEGFFVRRAGEVVRLGAPCDAGLDAVTAGDELLVVCARRARPDAAKDGGLVAWRLGPRTRDRVLLPGRIGEESEGLAVAVHDDALTVVWQDGTPGAFQVWRLDASLPELEPKDEPQRLSSPRFAAGSPTLFTDGEQLAVVWAELWASAEARHRAEGHVVVSVDGAIPRTLVEVVHPEPRPVIARDGAGLLLLFRDHREPLERPSLFGHRLTSDLRLHGGLRLIGRADEGGPVRTFGCRIDGELTQVAVVGRSWGAEDSLVAAHLLDDSLSERFHELQVYEFGGQLALGDGVCEANSLDLLIGERTDPNERGASLFTIPARCGAGPYPRTGHAR